MKSPRGTPKLSGHPLGTMKIYVTFYSNLLNSSQRMSVWTEVVHLQTNAATHKAMLRVLKIVSSFSQVIQDVLLFKYFMRGDYRTIQHFIKVNKQPKQAFLVN